MIDTSKLNNYHFGKHVFEYFPWYSYDNLDINKLPTLDNEFRKKFDFAFKRGSIVTIWVPTKPYKGTQYFSALTNTTDVMIVRNGEFTVKGMSETVNDWEDIEKNRLRCIVGTKKEAEYHFKVISLFNDFFYQISDMIFTQGGNDKKMTIINLNDFKIRGNKEVILKFIEDEDVYKFLRDYENIPNIKSNSFLHSVKKQYSQTGSLSIKQINVTKEVMYYNTTCDVDNITVIKIQINGIKNIERVVNYLSEIGLKYQLFNDFILTYL